MKRLNRKQKLIVAIAIILIVVIVAIVITTNIVSNNSQIANEGYFATTTNASSNIIASYIKEGIKVGGITGTLKTLDTSDANATPEDIAWGKTGYVNGVKITGTRDDSTLAQLKKSGQAVTENTTVQDRYNNSVKIPEGFKIAEDSATVVTEGVVIEDVSAGNENTKGSQFVWIPVGDVITDTNGRITTITLGRYTFDSNGKETLVQSAKEYANETQLKTSSTDSYYYQELLNTTSSINTKAKDIKAFVTKATTSGGYYLGRYEAGDATATDSARNISTDDFNPVTCKAGVYPYNYVTQSQASRLSQGMYDSSNFESDLINSYAWDTAIVFIQTFSGDSDYSMQSRLQSTLARCGEATDGTNKDIRCNIYDMAGNTCEWSTETISTTGDPCVNRGAYYDYDLSYTKRRGNLVPTSGFSEDCFRPTLYL